MRIIAICRPAAGVDPARLGTRLGAESTALQALAAKGSLLEAYTLDVPGAILILECRDQQEAARCVSQLPLLVAGLIDVEISALHPMPLGA